MIVLGSGPTDDIDREVGVGNRLRSGLGALRISS